MRQNQEEKGITVPGKYHCVININETNEIKIEGKRQYCFEKVSLRIKY